MYRLGLPLSVSLLRTLNLGLRFYRVGLPTLRVPFLRDLGVGFKVISV